MTRTVLSPGALEGARGQGERLQQVRFGRRGGGEHGREDRLHEALALVLTGAVVLRRGPGVDSRHQTRNPVGADDEVGSTHVGVDHRHDLRGAQRVEGLLVRADGRDDRDGFGTARFRGFWAPVTGGQGRSADEGAGDGEEQDHGSAGAPGVCVFHTHHQTERTAPGATARACRKGPPGTVNGEPVIPGKQWAPDCGRQMGTRISGRPADAAQGLILHSAVRADNAHAVPALIRPERALAAAAPVGLGARARAVRGSGSGSHGVHPLPVL